MAVELEVGYVSVIPEVSRVGPGIREAVNRAESNLKFAPQVDTNRLGSDLRSAGQRGSESFLSAFKSYTQQGLSPVGTAIGLGVGRSIGAGIEANRSVFHAAGQMIGTTIKAGLIGVVGASALTLGGLLFKGFERIESVEVARIKLEAMGKSSEEVETTITSVGEAIAGTATNMVDAMDAARKAVSAGVKPGQDLVRYLKDVQDVAAITGQDLEEVSSNFAKAAAGGAEGGEVMRRQLLSMQSQGIPILRWLAEEYGVTTDAMKKMVTAGDVDLAHFESAVEYHMGNAAEAMANTVGGQIKILQQNLAIASAGLISAMFGGSAVDASQGMVNALRGVNDKVVELSNWINAHRDEIHRWASDAAKGIQEIATVLGKIAEYLANHPAIVKAALAIWAGIEITSAIANALKLAAGVRELATAVGLLKAAEIGGIATEIGALGTSAGGAAAGIGAAGTALGALGVAMAGLAGITAPTWLWPLLTGAPAADWMQDIFNKPGPTGAESTPPTITPGAPTTPGQVGTPPGSAGFGGSPLNPQYRQWPSGQGANIVPPGGTGARSFIGTGATGYSLPPSPQSFAGIVKAQELSGLPYMSGTTDCSGYLSQVYSAMVGHNVHFTTMADFAALGFHRGYMPGALNIGVIPQPGNAGHMAGTLPNGINIESGGRSGAVTYNSATGALDPQFTQQWWFMPGYRSGGLVPGSGSGDKIPILGEPGEWMLNRGEVNAMGGPSGVAAFVGALHMQEGGAVEIPDWVKTAAAAAGISPQDYLASITLSATAGVGALPGPAEHLGTGAAPGPTSSDHAQPAQDTQSALDDSFRFPGLEPTATGTVGIAGTSFIAKALNLPNEFIGFLIDTGAEIAQTAISAAISAGVAGGTMGVGAAAAPIAGAAGSQAAGFGLKIAAAEAKRLTSYGFQMAAIGIDSVIENLFSPIGGAPRWMGYDYTQFVPSMAMQAAQMGVTTGEKAINEAITQGLSGQQPGGAAGGPVQPSQMPGMQQTTGPVPQIGQAPAPTGPPDVAAHSGIGAAPGPLTPGAGAPPPESAPAPASAPPQQNPLDILPNLFGFDQGGWLMPNEVGVNLSARPEPVFSAQQWDMMAKPGAAEKYGTYIANITVSDVEEMRRELSKRDRLAAMRYSSRP